MKKRSLRQVSRQTALPAALALMASGTAWAQETVPAAEADSPAITTQAEGTSWTDGISLSGLVEVEASFWDGDGDNGSDVSLATVEFGVDAKINDWATAHILFLYEEGENDDNIAVDEANIRIGDPEVSPAYLTAGRVYVPFGRYDTMMVSDTLALDIGETQETAVQLGWESEEGGVYGSVWFFNGDTDDGGSDSIEHFGANIGFMMEQEGSSFDLGADWISSIGDSDGLALEAVDDYAGGVSVHATATLGDFEFMGEYLTALDDVDGPGTEVAAWNLEAGYHFNLLEKPNTVALGYQRTYEAESIELPKERVLGTWSVEVFDKTSVAFEYAHDENYDDTDNNTGTLQLATEF